jgi:hypothetical protein
MKKKDIKEYLSRSELVIEGNTCKWNIASVGGIGGTYIGTFVFKCYLNPSERLAAGRLYRELIGNNTINTAFISKREDGLAFSLAELKYRVIDSPPFWNSSLDITGLAGDIPDELIIDEVLEHAVAAELKYLAQIQVKKEELLKKAKGSAENLLNQKDKRGQVEDSDDDE